MEVTLQTEVESGASGFSVAGGGSEGIFVKQVLKESPASKVFSLKEGDQLLSATIFFDNIKYEDALKILQYSEPYKVQFNLKRKLPMEGKEGITLWVRVLCRPRYLSGSSLSPIPLLLLLPPPPPSIWQIESAACPHPSGKKSSS
uniref:PDZ domain-containing protein n=1 Tax=Anolis carolinensis TaxID=28377 RepID=A0A803TZU4_ANOCA